MKLPGAMLSVALSVLFGFIGASAFAEDAKWVNPTIADYGAVVSLPVDGLRFEDITAFMQ